MNPTSSPLPKGTYIIANPNRNPEEVTKTANQTADHLEQAVRSGDKDSYQKAMAEVETFRDKHTPEESKAYTAAVTKRLEDDKVLPTVSLFEAQVSFSKIDVGGNGRLEKGELDMFRNRKDVNDVQSALIGEIQKNYDQIRNISQYGETFFGFNSDAIADQDINDGVEQQRAIMNLHAPGKDGVSLYDRMQKDADGNIIGGTFYNALAGDQALARTLTPEDKQTIETLQKNQPFWSFNDFNKDSLTEFEKQSGLDPNVVQNQKRAARVATEVPMENLPPRQEQMQKDYEKEQATAQAKERDAAQAKEREAQARRDAYDRYMNSYDRDRGRYDRYDSYDRNNRDNRTHSQQVEDYLKERDYEQAAKRRSNEDKVHDALTVRSGESYAHSAERLLSLAGNNDPSSKELKDISHQLWIADQRRKKNELKTGQTLNLDSNLRHNPALAKLFDGSEL